MSHRGVKPSFNEKNETATETVDDNPLYFQKAALMKKVVLQKVPKMLSNLSHSIFAVKYVIDPLLLSASYRNVLVV